MKLKVTMIMVLLFGFALSLSSALANPGQTLELPDRDGLLDGSEAQTGASPGASSTSLNTVMSSTSSSDDSDEGFELEGRGLRIEQDASTDVWALDDYAYTGTFTNPCGGTSPDAGVWVWDVDDEDNPQKVTVIPTEAGDRANDVKAASMNSGDILVMSNEQCDGGDGGFEIYNVDDPTNPVKLASLTIDELNPVSDALFGGITDVGVHNLWLFTDGSNDYVAAAAGTAFDNFMIFDITNPSNPVLASSWGAEEIFDPGVGASLDAGRTLNAALWLLDGFGASANRFLHDVTISADGNQAYLSNWDAGLVLLDISDPTAPALISVAIDPANGSLDGEVNSHAVWPSADGAIVVEGEEDFSAWEGSVAPTNFIFNFDNPVPGVATGTTTGDAFAASQTGNSGTLTATSLDVTAGPLAGSSFSVAELGNNAMPLGAGSVSGPIVFIGQACNGDGIANPVAGAIAVARRGACSFSEKSINAGAAGATAIVIANNQASTPWSGMRIWDYSDPTAPILASTFNTVCSASSAAGGSCDSAGTYSAHNVVVDTDEDGNVLAYISWYWDGLLVLDVTDPYNPVEVARFLDDSTNGGFPNDFWGIYKIAGEDELYASDRSGGLYVFEFEIESDDDDDDD